MRMRKTMATNTTNRLRVSPLFCGHCEELLSLKTFRRHRKLYYNSETDEWITKARLNPSKHDCVSEDQCEWYLVHAKRLALLRFFCE